MVLQPPRRLQDRRAYKVNPLVFDATDESATQAFGAALAEVLPPGTTVALRGTLGAGKTRLVQAVAAACGVPPEEVTSPSFVLVQEYHGRVLLYHIDAYRIAGRQEFLELGPEEFFDSQAITLVEWADRVADCLPPQRLEIDVEVTGPQSRRFVVSVAGTALQDVPEKLAQALRARRLL
jgi:tRNA threonylcarbamoyladenosine biosynthesis protein TsaE